MAVPTQRSRSSRWALLASAIAVLALERFVPFGNYLLYPFTLLATWVHEMGHGVAAILVGGTFAKLEIFRDASGLAHVTAPPGVRDAIVSAAGLVAPPLVGGLLLALARGPRRATLLLTFLIVAILTSLVIWVRTPTGFIALGPLALVLAALTYFSDGGGRMLLADFIGVLLALDTITRIDYLFTSHATIGGTDRQSDVAAISHAIGGPFLLWGALLAALSIVLLTVGVACAWRRGSEAR